MNSPSRQIQMALVVLFFGISPASISAQVNSDDWTSKNEKTVQVKDDKFLDLNDTHFYVFTEQNVKEGWTLNGKAVVAGQKIPVSAPVMVVGQGTPTPVKRCDLTTKTCSSSADAKGAFCTDGRECVDHPANYACAVDRPACVAGGRGALCGKGQGDCYVRSLRCDSLTNTCKAGGDGPSCATESAACNSSGKYCSIANGSAVCVPSSSPDRNTWLSCSADTDCRTIKSCDYWGQTCGNVDLEHNGLLNLCNVDADCAPNNFCDGAICVHGFPMNKGATSCTNQNPIMPRSCAQKGCAYDYAGAGTCVEGVNGKNCRADTDCPARPIPTPTPAPAPSVVPVATPKPATNGSAEIGSSKDISWERGAVRK